MGHSNILLLVNLNILGGYMYIADLHCDSLGEVNSGRGFITRYNFSKRNPQLQLASAFIPARGESGAARRRRLMHMLDVYLAERARLELVPVLGAQDLIYAVECGLSSSIFSVEGGGGLTADSPELDSLFFAGMRVFGMVWDTNELGTSALDSNDLGLTDEGKRLATVATEKGIILDASHMSDRSIYELLELSPYPIIATHSNFREVCRHPRNLEYELARRITVRGGIIGISLYPDHLVEGADADITDILRHIDYALEKFGESSVGFGFDIDGTDGRYPRGISEAESIHDRVVDMLLSHYGESVVERIAGGNAIEFFKANL